MSFADQRPRVATAEEVKAPWGGAEGGKLFYCSLCGHTFQVGDTWRWVCASQKKLRNLMVCSSCDGEDVLERWVQWWEEWERLSQGKFRLVADRLKYAESHCQ